MHLVKLSADLQRCPVLGFWDIKPHKQAAAHTEEEEYEKAEALKMLLLKRKTERRKEMANCLSVLLWLVIV